jgi:hypothetical protein
VEENWLMGWEIDAALSGVGRGHFDHPHECYSYARMERKNLLLCFPASLKILESTKSAHIKFLWKSNYLNSYGVSPSLIPKKNQN